MPKWTVHQARGRIRTLDNLIKKYGDHADLQAARRDAEKDLALALFAASDQRKLRKIERAKERAKSADEGGAAADDQPQAEAAA